MMSKQNVPELRFPEFSEEWEEKELKSIADVIGGGTPSTSNEQFWNGETSWFTPSEIGISKYVENSLRKITMKGLKKSAAKLLPAGTILLTTRATLGRMSILKKQATTNQGFQSIVLKSGYSNEFIYYNAKSLIKHLFKVANGSTFLEVSNKGVCDFKLSIPIIEEQQKIGEFFSKIDQLIELEEKKLELLEEQKKGYMQKIFSQELRFRDENGNDYPEWEKIKLQDIFDYERPDQYIVSDAEYLQQGTPVLTANKAFTLGYTKENNFYDKGNCIIFDDFTLDNKYVDFPFKVKSSAIKILTAKKGYNTNFAYYLLNQVKLIKEGHARHYISVVQPTKVEVPCEKEQKTISDYLRSFDNLSELHKNKLKLLVRKKDGLLQKLFV